MFLFVGILYNLYTHIGCYICRYYYGIYTRIYNLIECFKNGKKKLHLNSLQKNSNNIKSLYVICMYVNIEIINKNTAIIFLFEDTNVKLEI